MSQVVSHEMPDRPASGLARWVKEPFNGLSHGVGAMLSAMGLVALVILAQGAAATTGAAIYGASLVLLFTASCLVHSIHCARRAEDVLERLDYAAIFFLIAGTYTPICLTALAGPWGYAILSAEWSLAIVGATMVLWRGPARAWVMLYLPMGWMVAIASATLIAATPAHSLILLLVGGIIYSLGAAVFVLKRPDPLPRWFGSHGLWHTMVLAGAACHFAAVAGMLA
jgi:hemolysin III